MNSPSRFLVALILLLLPLAGIAGVQLTLSISDRHPDQVRLFCEDYQAREYGLSYGQLVYQQEISYRAGEARLFTAGICARESMGPGLLEEQFQYRINSSNSSLALAVTACVNPETLRNAGGSAGEVVGIPREVETRRGVLHLVICRYLESEI